MFVFKMMDNMIEFDKADRNKVLPKLDFGKYEIVLRESEKVFRFNHDEIEKEFYKGYGVP